MNWQTVYVFISSTFNDMHAERDYLVKQVFPELRLWCAQRKLKLVDVDLRWGVSAADAQENKRVVEVCMKNIDKCRPFFLCFMGQRRGWVPGAQDVNPETLKMFPEIGKYLGKTSVTELEILHAIIRPFSSETVPVDHARFYFRDKGYLKQIKTRAHESLFCPKKGLLSRGDAELEHFKNEIRRKYPVVEYTCRWNAQRPSRELSGELSVGRLEDFQVKGKSLGSDVAAWLREEIAQAFPDHVPAAGEASELEFELDCQDTQLFQALDGYIPRPHEEDALMALIDEEADTPVMLVSEAGCGKTSLLAQMIERLRAGRRVYYRFVGTTPRSYKAEDLAGSLVSQWIDDGLLDASDGEYRPEELALMFGNIMAKAGSRRPFTLILDGIDQLSGGIRRGFIPEALPEGCGLVFSVRSDAGYVPGENVRVRQLGFMERAEDKARMVKGYLNTFLKDIDDDQLERLLTMPGSGNPLYMKIVLSELRQHGSFDTLFEMLSKDYGTTPLEAFRSVIERVRRQLADREVPDEFCNVFFGCLACAREGMDGDLYYRTVRRISDGGMGDLSREAVCDLVYQLFRELEPFLVQDGDRMLLRYDSLRRAFFSLKPDYGTVIHSCLAVAFGERAIEDDIPRYMEHSMYHIALADRDFIPLYFKSVLPMIWCIRNNGAALLGQTMRTIARERRLDRFEDPARTILRSSARLNTYPETLFMELRRYSDPENPIVQGILEGEEGYRDNRYFTAVTPPGGAALVTEEYTLGGAHVRGVEYNAPYFAIYAGDTVKIVESSTWKTVGMMPVGSRKSPYDTFRITAGCDRLYITAWNRGRLLSWRCLGLPGLSLIDECGDADMDWGTPAEMQVVDGRLCALFIERKERTGGFFEPSPTRPRLICVNTGETLFEANFSDDCGAKMLKRHLVLRDAGSGRWYIIRLSDGRVLAEDTFLGYENVERADMLAGGANLYAGEGRTLCLWLSGADRIDGKTRIVKDVRNYAFTDDGGLECIARSKDADASLSCLSVLSDGHILAEGDGVVSVLNSALEIVGHTDIGDTTAGPESWTGRFIMEDSDTLIVFRSHKIQKMSFGMLLGSLRSNAISTGQTRFDAAMWDGWLYCFGTSPDRINIATLEKRTAPGGEGPIERACVWNMDGEMPIVTTAVNGVNFTIHDPEFSRAPKRCRLGDADDHVLLHAFVYYDNDGDEVICQIVADREPVYHEYEGQMQPFFRCHFRMMYMNMFSGWNEWITADLDTDIMGKMPYQIKVESICFGGDAFVVFPNAYKNESMLELRIFRASNARRVFSDECPTKLGPLDSGKVFCYEKGLVYSYSKKGETYFGHLDLEEMRHYQDVTGRLPVECLPTDEYVYLRRQDSMDIEIYSLKTHAIIKSFTLSDRKMYMIRQILRAKDMLIVRMFDSDVLEAYDFESGKKLFEQRMEQTAEELFYDPVSERLVMLDTSHRVNIWEIGK